MLKLSRVLLVLGAFFFGGWFAEAYAEGLDPLLLCYITAALCLFMMLAYHAE